MRSFVLVAILVADLGMLLPSAVHADVVINVPLDHLTIQGAINAAVNGDEVVVAPGTYDEIIDLLGKSIIVRSSGGGRGDDHRCHAGCGPS